MINLSKFHHEEDVVLPLVTVVIPTYKRARQFLRRAIDSILQQSHQELEIIVIDDNIPDSAHRLETEQLLAEYHHEPRIKYLQNKQNLGGSLTRNVGINAANGEYITFLDDDDLYLPAKIETQLQLMEAHQLDMSFTDFRIHSIQDKLIDYRTYEGMSDWSKLALFKYHLLHHITGTNTYMYKREALLNLGGFDDLKMGQEFYLMLKTIDSGIRIGYLQEAHVINYVHPQERISNGQNKLLGEQDLYRFKQTKWHSFSTRERMFIRYRHFAVMSFTCLRARQWLSFIGYAMMAGLSSPLDIAQQSVAYLRKRRKHRTDV
jgi:glycosyltransferase involved in cell wall biosynthesis